MEVHLDIFEKVASSSLVQDACGRGVGGLGSSSTRIHVVMVAFAESLACRRRWCTDGSKEAVPRTVVQRPPDGAAKLAFVKNRKQIDARRSYPQEQRDHCSVNLSVRNQKPSV